MSYLAATTATTEDQARTAALDACIEQGCTVAGWGDEAPQRAMVEDQATAVAFESGLRVQVALASTLAGAAQVSDDWVDQGLTWFGPGSARIAASFATWSVPVVATQAAAPVFVGPQTQALLQADDGTVFLVSQPSLVTISSDTAYKGRIAVVARLHGTSGNQVPGAISRIIQGPAGLSIDGAAAQILTSPARDAETNAAAITRALGRWGTLSGGITAAGWRWIVATPDLGGIGTITRVFVDDANPFGPGTVALYLANAAGPATVGEVADAQAQVDRYTLAGTARVRCFAAAAATVSFAARLATDGSNPLAAAQGATALLQLASALTGDVLYLDAIIATLMAVRGVFNVPELGIEADIMRPSNGVIVLQPTVTQ